MNEGVDQSSNKFKLSEVRDYLYMKIKDNEYTDEEYGFYLELKRFGKKALHSNWSTYQKILYNMRKEYNGL